MLHHNCTDAALLGDGGKRPPTSEQPSTVCRYIGTLLVLLGLSYVAGGESAKVCVCVCSMCVCSVCVCVCVYSVYILGKICKSGITGTRGKTRL